MSKRYEEYYRILDLDVGASQDEVKKAFRELSHIWHPDNHMGKSSSVENRATEKFKELSNAYQVLKKYLSEEERKTEQDRRDREEEAQKRQEENERRKKEEVSRRKAEQDRQDREGKEHKYWEEQAKKKHEKEKSKQKNTEQLFVTCPECKEEIKASSTIKLRVICNSCSHTFHYFFEDGEIRIVSENDNRTSGTRDEKVEQSQNEVEQEPTLSMSAKVVLAVFIALLTTLFVLMWKGLGGGPIIVPRSEL